MSDAPLSPPFCRPSSLPPRAVRPFRPPPHATSLLSVLNMIDML